MKRLLKRFIFYYREFISKNIKAKNVIFWFVLTYLIYGILLFVIIPGLMTYTKGQPVFNMMPFGYDGDYARNLLLTMGEEGRHAYLYHLVAVNLFFPFLFAYCNLILTAYLLNRLQALRKEFIYLCLIPVFASFFYGLENLGIMAMLINYPDGPEVLIQFSSFFSVAKSLLLTIYFLVLFIILFLIWKRKKTVFGP